MHPPHFYVFENVTAIAHPCFSSSHELIPPFEILIFIFLIVAHDYAAFFYLLGSKSYAAFW